MILVTSGEKYVDIDALACAIAYAELLSLEGRSANAYIPGVLNNTITEVIKGWGLDFTKKIDSKDNQFVIVDISDPDHIAKAATQEKIIEVYDHHFGFEEYWRNKIGDRSKIEPVGACATQIWEEFRKRGFANKISKVSANLLYTAIIQNTLNFNAKLANERDENAFKELSKHISVPKNWAEIYYSDREKEISQNIEEAIRNDIKVQNLPGFDKPVVIGQLELWDIPEFLNKSLAEIKASFNGFDTPYWFMNLSSRKENINYIYAENDRVKEVLTRSIKAKFVDNVGTTDHHWLRKEIIRELLKLN